MIHGNNDLKETFEWIDTLAQEANLSNEERQEANVLARRSLNKDSDQLPKTVAREAVRHVQNRNDQRFKP